MTLTVHIEGDENERVPSVIEIMKQTEPSPSPPMYRNNAHKYNENIIQPRSNLPQLRKTHYYESPTSQHYTVMK